MSSARRLVCSALSLGGILAFSSGSTLAQERWEDVLPRVRQRCAEMFQNSFTMQSACISAEHTGWDDVNRDVPTAQPDRSTRSSPRPTQSETSAVPPGRADGRVEDELIAIVGKYARLFENAPNDMVKGGLRPERGQELCTFMTVSSVRSWRGKVYSLSSNNEGHGILKIDLGGDVYVKTMNNGLSDMEYGTLIKHGSSLFNETFSLHVDQIVEFSGSLFNDNLDCFKELSLTVGGAMRRPEFLIRFSSVRGRADSDAAGQIPTISTGVPAAPAASPPIAAIEPATAKPWEPSNSLLQSPAFLDGKNARTAYEAWFSSIVTDEYRAGATFWASNRSSRAPPICHYSGKDFENGCLEAKRILTPMDDRRKAEPDFKQGWNNP